MFEYKAKVLAIVDTSTFDLEIDLGFKFYTKQRVRLWGVMPIDTKALEAKTLLEQLVQDSVIVQTKFTKRGKVGRILGTIWTVDKSGNAHTNINELLLKNNFAKTFKELD